MSEMTDNEVLSVLNRMDAEQRTMESLQSARKHVRQVIERYQEIMAELPSLETAHAEHMAAKAELQQEFEHAHEKCRADMQLKLDEARSLMTEADAKVAKAQERAQVAERDAQEKEEFAAKRGAQLDSEIQAKVEQLRNAESAFEAFKREHKLG
jgi:chromosome segregation ATPase